METKQETTQLDTISFIVTRDDGRCKGWAKKLTRSEILALNLAQITGANSIPGNYLKNGTDLELRPFEDFVLWGEEIHHNKNRGWLYRLYYPGKIGMGYLTPCNEIKQKIKSEGMKHLMAGSGEIAAMVRAAKYICEPEQIEERVIRKNNLFAAIP